MVSSCAQMDHNWYNWKPKLVKMAKDRPTTVQAWTNTAQDGTKMVERWYQKETQWTQERPKMLRVASRWPKDGCQITRDGLKMASKLA